MALETTEAVRQLTAEIKTRNELEAKLMTLNERREIREYYFRMFLAAAVLLLAGIKVAEIAGLIT